MNSSRTTGANEKDLSSDPETLEQIAKQLHWNLDPLASRAIQQIVAALRQQREAGRAEAQPEDEPPWQPIETAPRDGTRILTFGPDGIVTAYYDKGVKGHEDQFPAGWKNAFNPTHWLPLPSAPGAEDET